MPELPEVEAARRAVEEHCKGGIIIRAEVAEDSKVIEGIAPFDMQAWFIGKRIIAAHRKGKQLWLEMDKPPSPCFQFGMAGAVYIKGVKLTKYIRSAVNDEDEWPSKYSKVLLELDTGVQFSFTDKRRFARIRLLEDPAKNSPVSELGPDAYTELPEEAEFAEAVRKKKVAIKGVLLDQSFLAGIGNWIADEVLYQSRVHPERPASSLSIDECKLLRQAIKEVLETSVGLDADSSKFPEGWIFHHREKKSSAALSDGKKIEFITVGGRTSAFVPELQKYDAVEGGPKKRANTRKKAATEDEVDEEDGNGKKKQPKGKTVKKAAAPKKSKQPKQSSDDDEEEKPKGRARPSRAKAASSKIPEEPGSETCDHVYDEDVTSSSTSMLFSGVGHFATSTWPIVSSLCEWKGRSLVPRPAFILRPGKLPAAQRFLRSNSDNARRLASYVLRKSACFL